MIPNQEGNGLSEEEIERRRRDADVHADEDKQKRQLAELRNRADTMTWQLEKLIQEHEAKLSGPDKEAMAQAIEQTRAAAKGENVETLKAAIHQLEQASHALSRALYATADAQAGAGDDAAQGPTASPATLPPMAARRTPSTPSSWSIRKKIPIVFPAQQHTIAAVEGFRRKGPPVSKEIVG